MAIRKRIATKEIGGRSRNPILIASQVELQTTQSAATPPARPIRLWAANGVSTMWLSFSSTRDHRVLVAIRKDGLAPECEEVHEKILLAALGATAKTPANQP